MPWNSTEDLPEDIRTTLPSKAQEIFLNAFNSAWNGPCKDKAGERDPCTFQRAWGAVKNLYRQEGDKWVSKAAINTEPTPFIIAAAQNPMLISGPLIQVNKKNLNDWGIPDEETEKVKAGLLGVPLKKCSGAGAIFNEHSCDYNWNPEDEIGQIVSAHTHDGWIHATAKVTDPTADSKIRFADAFRRATTSITNRSPKDIGDGKFENIMVREVVSDSNEIMRYIIREETDSQNRRINYGKVGQAVFNRQLEKASIGMDPRFEHHKQKIMQVYGEYSEYYVGSHIRDMVFKMLNSTLPVSVRPAGGVYFVANIHAALVESLEEFVTDINAWGVPGTGDAVFESVPMLDVEKQRKLIFDKYESQCAYSVDITLNELAGLLNSEKTPTKGTLTSYVNKVKELKKGIGKYEELLERDMQLSRTKCQFLQEQVIQLLDKASVSEIVPDVAVPV